MKTWFRYIVLAAALLTTAASAPQSRQLNQLMRQKLSRSEKVLEALVTSDWVSLETNSRELEALTRQPQWNVLQYPEYVQHSLAFVRSVEALRAAAGTRDLDRAATAYNEMTLTCIDCHRYVARMRLTR
jgi:hypothetical protein